MVTSSANDSPTGARWFVAGVFGLWALFFVLAWLTPVLLDDWYQLTWHRHHEFGLASIWEYAHYNYFHFNPRVGDVLLLVVNGPRAFHLVLSPLVQLSILWLAFALAFGRWPRPSIRDLQLLLILQVMIWLITPIPGIVYFYRPFATNYLWAFATTMALLAPYRLALARPAIRPRHWLIPIMFVVGWFAGMSNEHTGPAAMVALAIFVIWAWRVHRLKPWMISGLLGLYVGYPMLFFAPGQTVRYAGMATRNTPLRLLSERGLDGCFEIMLEFLAEAQIGTNLFLLAVLLYLASHRRRGIPLPALPRATIWTTALLIVAAGAIVVTLFASPTVGERLFFASSVLFACGLLVVIEHLFHDVRTRRFLVITCAIIFGYHAFRLVWVYAAVKNENDHRLAILDTAPPGTVAEVPPYKYRVRTRWHWGDDFRYASLREYVGNEVFDLRGIELDKYVRWMQPTPPEHYVATRTFTPPLPPDVAATLAPLSYIPTYWEWTLVQLRRMLALGPLGSYPGHQLTRYTVDAVGLDFEDELDRPIRVIEWTPSTITFVDGRPYDDPAGRPFIQLWKDTLPPNLTGSYVVACGRTRRVDLVVDGTSEDPLVPISLDCRGTYTALLCQADLCWHAGRYWR